MVTDTANASTGSSSDEHPKKSDSTNKNLIVCIDGTSNQFGSSNTNVVKLCDAVDLETSKKKQLVHYSSGIGTRSMKEAISDKLDMAVAWSVDENIKEAYGWLAEKYEKGDDIFLFGFSRGAYQVRALAGMIHEVGLIRTRTQRQIDRAYNYYEAIGPGTPEARYIAKNFKKTFCWGDDLKIHFIGVWDTVSSVGLSRGDVSLPMSSTAGSIRHALALDECRVKFMPEYFRKTSFNITDKPLNVRLAHSSGGDQDTSDIKEVWFAGSHSDVGGVDRPGKAHHAGNISLSWMYREAAECGLVLRPTDVTWGPDDIDSGTKNSMSAFWYIPEYIAMRQQVSYNGSRKEALRMHKWKPRVIMPHQKVHASILYANMYRPLAKWARGFDMSMTCGAPEDTRLDEAFWETDLFSDREAEELVNSLGRSQLGAPECLEKLLFMLRFNEGKKCVRNVSGWQKKFCDIIDSSDYAPHVRLVANVAYYEASCDPQENSQDPVQPHKMFLEMDAEECLRSILEEPRHRYKLTMVALLNSLTRHKYLQERILTPNVLTNFMKLVDLTIDTTAKGKVLTPGQRENNFIQVIKGLNALLQCETTRDSIIKKLVEPQKSKVPRLCRVLEVNNPHFLVAALRMILTLARMQNVQEAKDACFKVQSRICELGKKHDGIIGPLAVEIWLALYDSNGWDNQLSLDDAHVRENLASTLFRTDFDVCSLVGANSSLKGLASIFGLDAERPVQDAEQLNEQQKKLIKGLTKAIASRKGDPRVRTTLTMTLLKLCEIDAIRTYLRHEIGLVDMLVNQLQVKKSALLAAYALATCLTYSDMKESIEANPLFPKHIVGMLRQDYFDDAIGQVEGLTIFVYLMQQSNLRERVVEHKIMKVLGSKAAKGQLKNILSGLLSMKKPSDAADMSSTCTQELVDTSLKLLRDPNWKMQKIGVTILTALAQTPGGAETVKRDIPTIIRMILSEKYQPPGSSQPSASVGEGQAPSVAVTRLRDSLKWPPRPASEIMGPACALHSLQKTIRGTEEYRILTHIHVSRTLISEKETLPWRVYTPTKCDVATMLEKMIQAVEEELSERGLMRIGDALPPAVHWDRALMFFGYSAAGAALLPLALVTSIGLSALTLLALVACAPFYLSQVDALNAVQRSHNRKSRGPDEIRNSPAVNRKEDESALIGRGEGNRLGWRK